MMVLSFRDVSKFPSVNTSDMSFINSETRFNILRLFQQGILNFDAISTISAWKVQYTILQNKNFR